MRILKLHQQFKYNLLVRKPMFAKTEFNPSNHSLIQFPKGSRSPKRKKRPCNTGDRKTASRNNSNSPRIILRIHSMMGLPLPQERHTMAISAQAPSRMWFADMHHKLDTMFLEDLDGIATACPSNMKLIKL